MKKYFLSLLCILLLIISCEHDHDQPGIGSIGEIALSGDKYREQEENPFIAVTDQPISTFSIDADGASYANVRRFILQENQLPPKGAIRTEELINYFDLNYSFDQTLHPISLNGEVSSCPWNPEHKLIRIGIKGQPIAREQLPASNFVFLIDVSGSMASSDKLELLKKGFHLFADQLQAYDRVAIVTYAGSAGVVLESTPGNEKDKIKEAISKLGAGGSTAGAEGIVTAYKIAQQYFIAEGNNRVILGTDGDFNVGVSSQEELVKLIEEKRKLGIFLTVLGVGRGNLNDAALEQIANKGNGTYEYIDHVEQLKKVFVYEYSKFFTVAKDVKTQIEFSKDNVEAYRLLGYENRLLDTEDFEDDREDAGEIGANQNVTALYEIKPKATIHFKTVPTFTINFRYKKPDGDSSIPLTLAIYDQGESFSSASDQMKVTASMAAFSMLLVNSAYKGTSSYESIISWLNSVTLPDEHGFRGEFQTIVEHSKAL